MSACASVYKSTKTKLSFRTGWIAYPVMLAAELARLWIRVFATIYVVSTKGHNLSGRGNNHPAGTEIITLVSCRGKIKKRGHDDDDV